MNPDLRSSTTPSEAPTVVRGPESAGRDCPIRLSIPANPGVRPCTGPAEALASNLSGLAALSHHTRQRALRESIAAWLMRRFGNCGR